MTGPKREFSQRYWREPEEERQREGEGVGRERNREIPFKEDDPISCTVISGNAYTDVVGREGGLQGTRGPSPSSRNTKCRT